MRVGRYILYFATMINLLMFCFIHHVAQKRLEVIKNEIENIKIFNSNFTYNEVTNFKKNITEKSTPKLRFKKQLSENNKPVIKDSIMPPLKIEVQQTKTAVNNIPVKPVRKKSNYAKPKKFYYSECYKAFEIDLQLPTKLNRNEDLPVFYFVFLNDSEQTITMEEISRLEPSNIYFEYEYPINSIIKPNESVLFKVKLLRVNYDNFPSQIQKITIPTKNINGLKGATLQFNISQDL